MKKNCDKVNAFPQRAKLPVMGLDSGIELSELRGLNDQCFF